MEDYISKLTEDDQFWFDSFRIEFWRDAEFKIFLKPCTRFALDDLRIYIERSKLVCEIVRYTVLHFEDKWTEPGPESKGIALRVYAHAAEIGGEPRLLTVLSHDHLPWEMESQERLSRAYNLFYKICDPARNRDFIKHYGLAPIRPKYYY